MRILWDIYVVFLVIAVLEAVLLSLFTYENTRYFRVRLRQPKPKGFHPFVELIVPCKGLESAFEQLVHSVLNQEYPNYAVTFVVESVEDPVFAHIQDLLRQNLTVRARLIVAGQANKCGQKVHNLRSATDRIDPDVEVLAFVDSDTELPTEWLARLVNRLREPGVGAASGYRWLFPVDGTLAGFVFAALNGRITFGYGNHFMNQIWGGSWGILRKTFDALCIRDAWIGALTEDLPVSSILRRNRLRIAFEPWCLVASRVNDQWSKFFEFARRQYLIVRIYAPAIWWLVLLGDLVYGVAFWGGIILLATSFTAAKTPWWIAALLIFIYLAGVFRAMVRRSAVRARFPDRLNDLTWSTRLDLFAQPCLALINLGCILSSAWGRTITWRGIRYRLEDAQHTKILFRSRP